MLKEIWCFIKVIGGVFSMDAGIGLVLMTAVGCIWSVGFLVPSMAFVLASGITTVDINVSTMMRSAATTKEVLEASTTTREAQEAVSIRRAVVEAASIIREVLAAHSTRRAVVEAASIIREVLAAHSTRRAVPVVVTHREVLEVAAIMDSMMETSNSDKRVIPSCSIDVYLVKVDDKAEGHRMELEILIT
jgi:hypothetical protein